MIITRPRSSESSVQYQTTLHLCLNLPLLEFIRHSFPSYPNHGIDHQCVLLNDFGKHRRNCTFIFRIFSEKTNLNVSEDFEKSGRITRIDIGI